MKLAITGHTKGIGKAIADLYPEHIGFSRSNGYDIANKVNRMKILYELTNCDVFINNAWDANGQLCMYKEIYEHWRHDKDKTIVNINSRGKYYKDMNLEYYDSKAELFEEVVDNMIDCTMSSSQERNCRIININPGYVMTEMGKPSIEEFDFPYLTPAECAYYIKWAIDQPIEIFELSLSKL